MKLIELNDVNYVLGDYILNNAPIYSKCCRSSRDIIKKKKIESNNYIFAKLNIKTNKWAITDGKSAKCDKVLIRDIFIEENIPELQTNKNNKNIDESTIEKAPEIIQLTDEEKFKDDDNILEIETRGDREYDKIYFKVKDVEREFNMPNLQISVIDRRNDYINLIHYKYFTRNVKVLNLTKTSKIIKAITELYLTYEGMLRVLFVSKNGKTSKFIKWATQLLFIHQMGTIEQKQELSASLLGLNTKTIKDVFNSSSNKTPTVYLFNLGSANQVLKTDIYLEDDILCKYGCTEDISRRTSEHERNYKKQYQTDISLLIYSIIDPKYIFDAENNIKQYFKSNKINEDDKTELIIINKKNLEQIKQHYKMIQNSYIGRYEEMNKQIIKLESIIKEEIHKNEILQIQHKNEILEKEIETNNRISQLEKTVLEQQIKLLTK